ncbi:formyl transferase [Ciceribacter sp. L1K23]|uniref:formyl transferase n=1 Tax=Ciceribacter sp. L1K23 TaxID=2820276 RepID=UPI0020125B30|nr:formyl transferase [Ciceribacter sp. L1K23]
MVEAGLVDVRAAARRVVVMTDGGQNSRLVVCALASHFPDIHVIVETPEAKGEILRRRARARGWLDASGQLATMALAKLLRLASRDRVQRIIQSTGLRAEFPPNVAIIKVPDVNSDACLDSLRDLTPAVILLVSTRLLKPATLAAIRCPIVNLHAGINPTYRGQMGGYWSLALGDRGNFGATIHLVDAGTDTGATLAEVRTVPTDRDNISTYPLLLTAVALPALAQTIGAILKGTARTIPSEGVSALRFPPPIWLWIWYAVTRRVW